MSALDSLGCERDQGLSFSYEPQGETASASWNTTAKIIALKIASYLTDPICKVREYFYSFYILDKICDSTCQKIMKSGLLALGMISFSLLTPFTAPIGVAIRGMVAFCVTDPYNFIYLERGGQGKVLPEDKKNYHCFP